jgi:hypothetical protein
MDDKCIIRHHGPEELNDFLNNLKNIHPNIQFTMKRDSNGHFPSWTVTYTKDQMASWGTMCTGNPPTPTCVYMLSHTTTQPIRMLGYSPWYIKLEPSLTRKISQESWDSSVVHSIRMATVTGRSVLSIHPI